MKTTKIVEEFEIPGTDITLEVGDSFTVKEVTVSQKATFELGRKVSYEIGQAALKPSPQELKNAAFKIGISVKIARQALDVFNWN